MTRASSTYKPNFFGKCVCRPQTSYPMLSIDSQNNLIVWLAFYLLCAQQGYWIDDERSVARDERVAPLTAGRGADISEALLLHTLLSYQGIYMSETSRDYPRADMCWERKGPQSKLSVLNALYKSIKLSRAFSTEDNNATAACARVSVLTEIFGYLEIIHDDSEKVPQLSILNRRKIRAPPPEWLSLASGRYMSSTAANANEVSVRKRDLIRAGQIDFSPSLLLFGSLSLHGLRTSPVCQCLPPICLRHCTMNTIYAMDKPPPRRYAVDSPKSSHLLLVYPTAPSPRRSLSTLHTTHFITFAPEFRVKAVTSQCDTTCSCFSVTSTVPCQIQHYPSLSESVLKVIEKISGSVCSILGHSYCTHSTFLGHHIVTTASEFVAVNYETHQLEFRPMTTELSSPLSHIRPSSSHRAEGPVRLREAARLRDVQSVRDLVKGQGGLFDLFSNAHSSVLRNLQISSLYLIRNRRYVQVGFILCFGVSPFAE
eukprot:sb/3464229/